MVRLQAAAAGYRGTPAWSDLTLEVAAGEFVVVLGGNGSGKTTLLRLLLGQLPPLAGQVEVLGARPRRGNPRVGYIPQQRSVDPALPVRGIDLVRLGRNGHRWGLGKLGRSGAQSVERALAEAGAAGYAIRPFGALSGGEQQRIRVAQALVADPVLLLADEPLLSLDLASQQQVTALLDRRRRTAGTAVILVTHEINPVLPYADRVVYLAAGRWAAGSPDDVLRTTTLSGLYSAPVEVIRVAGRVLIFGTPDSSHHPQDRTRGHG